MRDVTIANWIKIGLLGEQRETAAESTVDFDALLPSLDVWLDVVDGKVEIDVRGDLTGILTLSIQTKNPAGVAGSSQVKMVAGTGFEPVTFRL